MKNFFRDNGGLLVVAAVLLAVLLGIGSAITGKNPLASVVHAITAPLGTVSTQVSQWFQGQLDRLTQYDALLEEHQAAKKSMAELERTVRESQDALRENQRLRDLLGVSRAHPDWKYASATITQRSTTNWGSQFTMDAGTREDVAVGDCVIDQYGNLVGVVRQVGENWSLVATVLDPGLEMGVRVPRTDDSVVAQGDFNRMQEGRLKLTYVAPDAHLVSGDQVVTSGLGGQYPSGLLVGYLEHLETEADGISRTGVLKPSADVEHIRYVYIVTQFGGNPG